MHIDSLTIDDLHNLTERELVDLMYSTLFEVKPIIEERLNLLEIAKTDKKALMFDADFNVARKFIKYENEPDSYILKVPYMDERENVELQMQMFTDKKNDVLPIVNYFIYVFTRVIQHPLGIVEIKFIGQHIKRNDNDFQYDRFEHKYSESEFMYFDKEKNIYVQVNSAELKKAKHDLEKGKSIEDTLEEVKVYLQREELLKTAKLLLKESGNKFLKELIVMKNGRSNKGFSINDHFAYLNRYSVFMEKLELGLKIYLLFANISVREYQKLKSKSIEINELISELKSSLVSLAKMMYESDRYSLNKNDILSKSIKLHFETEEDRFYKNMVNQFTVLEDFLKANVGSLDLAGYIGFDLEKWELYPNIVQVEKKRNFTTKATNFGEQREFENKILKFQMKKEE
ncbi:hypothetical protein [Pseudalkalibacillus hwajinpoensis]|uniref:hypothetical protein n=1 Tax=Guptibacillus hwajinpoensis TaxID=208199 RepID=UPI003850D91D